MSDSKSSAGGVEFQRVLGLGSATAVVIGAIVGVGIFLTPGGIAQTTGSAQLALTAWILGGVIALFGALTFAELGGVYSRAGGQYEAIRDAYGPFMGFLFVFCNATAVQAGALAVIANFAGKYLLITLGVVDPAPNYCVLLGSLIVVLLGIANWLGVRWGAFAQNACVIAKMATLVLVVWLAVRFTGAENLSSTSEVVNESVRENGLLAVLLAGLVPALFAYGGWQHALWVGGEVKNPSRNIPLAIMVGVLIVIAVYVSLNVALFHLLGFAEVVKSKTVVADAVAVVWPKGGRQLVSATLTFSAIGVLNAQLFSGPRLICGMARDGRFFKPFGILDARFATPHLAIALLAGMGLLLLWLVGADRTDNLLNGVVLIDSVFFLLTGLGLILLRRRTSPSEWPFRAPLFPLFPALFCVGEILVICGAFSMEKYRNSAYISLIWIAAAAVLYFLFFWKKADRSN
ncbi:MAG: amino acid permease [Pirellulaceae bacterium]